MECPLFYLPSLHRALAPAHVPATVVFFPSGLAREGTREGTEDGDEDPATAAVRDAVKKTLPFKKKEASVILGEMLGVGEAYAGSGFLRQLYANHAFMEGQFKWEGAPGEFADLDVFAATGKAPAAMGQQPAVTAQTPAAMDRTSVVRRWDAAAQEQAGMLPAVRRALAECQKVLLLAWWREEKLVELAGLERRFHAAEHALNAALADGDGETAAQEQGPVSASEDAGVPWRVMLDAALPFLPEGGAVFTADETMARDLLDAGMLRPLPGDSASLFASWPPELVAGLLYAELPAWRLVGRRECPAERPWLDRETAVFVSRPRNGRA